MQPLEAELKTQGFPFVIGIDEAGRGPLAGPVVAAAVYLHSHSFDCSIADSKKLSPRQREKAFHEICQKADIGIGMMSELVIDEVNILQATFFAMHNAVNQLVRRIEKKSLNGWQANKVCLLIDGNQFRSDLPYTHKTVVDGDAHVLSIASASIIAKVTRDRILDAYDQIYPEYGFRKHKGYPTQAHREAIKNHGFSSIHRRSFAVRTN